MIKYIVIGILILIALLDYALLVASSNMERREEYKHEERLRSKDDEGHDI